MSIIFELYTSTFTLVDQHNYNYVITQKCQIFELLILHIVELKKVYYYWHAVIICYCYSLSIMRIKVQSILKTTKQRN